MKVGALVLLYIVTPLSLITWFICLVNYSHSEGSERGLYRPVGPFKFALSIILPSYLAYNGIRKKSLTTSGALAAMIIGWILCLVHYGFLVSLLTFYVVGSKATKFRISQKSQFDENADQHTARNCVQVLSNGGVATIFTLFYCLEDGCVETPIDFVKSYSASWWSVSVLGAISCSCGDTLASELGPVLPFSQPYLVTSFQRVPKGTNGGVSIAGTVASGLGGLIVGMSFYITLLLSVDTEHIASSAHQWPVIALCTLAGFIGSLIDSLIGSTFQYSGLAKGKYVVERPDPSVKDISGRAIFDNHAVNLISTIITSLIMPRIAFYIWWFLT